MNNIYIYIYIYAKTMCIPILSIMDSWQLMHLRYTMYDSTLRVIINQRVLNKLCRIHNAYHYISLYNMM